jgi:hypothetical protein
MTPDSVAVTWRFGEALASETEPMERARLGLMCRRYEQVLDATDGLIGSSDLEVAGTVAVVRAQALLALERSSDAAPLLRSWLLQCGDLQPTAESTTGGIGGIQRAASVLLADTMRQTHPAVQVVVTPHQGKVLLARRDAAPGDVLVQEAPLVKWCGRGSAHVPSAAFVDAYLALATVDQRCVLSMCAPPQTSTDSIELLRAAQKLQADHAPARQIALRTLCTLGLVERINAHTYAAPQSDDGDAHQQPSETSAGVPAPTSVLFDVMSKASHSCAPNCIYDAARRAYVALRPVARGEEIGFPYFARQHLAQPAHLRTAVLHRTHQIAECLCTRCRSDRENGDPCRGIKCGEPRCGGTRFRRSGSVVPSDSSARSSGRPMWVCDGPCREAWLDREMPLAAEESLGQKVYGLWMQREKPEKGYFEAVKAATLEVAASLGTRHWAYYFAIEAAQHFFFFIARRASARTADVARSCAALFTHKLVAAAAGMRLHETAPLLVAEACLSAARRLSDTAPHLRTDVVVLAVTGSRLAVVEEIFPESLDTAWLRQASSESALYNPHIAAAQRGEAADPTTAYRLVEGGDAVWRKTKEDDTDIFAAWEDHLTARVVGEMNQAQQPRLPQHIQDAMRGRALAQ